MAADKPTPLRIVLLAAMGFVSIGSYGLARPAVESMFLGSYGADYLPWVWLCVAASVFVVVAIYNRFSGRTHPATLFGSAALLSALALAIILAMRSLQFRWADFVLYVWKDVYIVVLIEIFWTYANLIIQRKTARWLYGVFLVCGTLGSVTAELSIGFIAKAYGTASGLNAVTVVLLLLAGLCWWASQRLPIGTTVGAETKPPLTASFNLLAKNRYIGLLVGLVAASQIVITLVDFQFNEQIALLVPDVDERTALVGRVYATINGSALLLQLCCGIVLRYVGVGRTLLALPVVVGSTVMVGLLVPGFLLLAAAKVGSKAFDYSLFRAAKEILYIPLSHDEKTRGKALVDILGYRTAKASASLFLLSFLARYKGSTEVAIVIFLAAWLVLSWLIAKQHRQRIQPTEQPDIPCE